MPRGSGTAKPCCGCDGGTNTQQLILCDDDGVTVVQFIRHIVYNSDGIISSTFDTDLTMFPYTVQGTVEVCA